MTLESLFKQLTTKPGSRRAILRAGAGATAAALASRVITAPALARQATPAAGSETCPVTTPEDNKALVERYWSEVWTAGGDQHSAELLAPDEIHHWGNGGQTEGPDAFNERLNAFLNAFPDFSIRIDEQVAEDDLVFTRYTATGTQQGEWAGIPATGNAVEYTGMNLFRIACGAIAESRGEADHLGLLIQLGGVPGRTLAAIGSGELPLPGYATPASCASTTTDENRAIARRWITEQGKPNVQDALNEFAAEDVYLHATGFPDSRGTEPVAGLFQSLYTAFPDLTYTIEDGPAEGDLVVVGWSATGTHSGEFQGIPATGNVVTFTGFHLLRIACGKVAEVWAEADTLGRLRQIGGIAPAATPVS